MQWSLNSTWVHALALFYGIQLQQEVVDIVLQSGYCPLARRLFYVEQSDLSSRGWGLRNFQKSEKGTKFMIPQPFFSPSRNLAGWTSHTTSRLLLTPSLGARAAGARRRRRRRPLGRPLRPNRRNRRGATLARLRAYRAGTGGCLGSVPYAGGPQRRPAFNR